MVLDIQQKKETLKKPLRRSLKAIHQEYGGEIATHLETSSGVPLRYIQSRYKEARARMAESQARFEKRNRVTSATMILMLSVAGFFDLVQAGLNFIPLLGWILSFLVGLISWLVFYIWTSIKGWDKGDTAAKWGANFLSKTKIFAKYVTPIIALIPIINELPEITLGVLLSLLILRSEDLLYNQSKGKLDYETIKEGASIISYLKSLV